MHDTPTENLFWRPLDGRALECTACPARCRLEPGLRGACGGRENLGGVLDTAPAAAHCRTGPIETRALYHFLPGSRALCVCTGGVSPLCFCPGSPQAPRANVPTSTEHATIAAHAREQGCATVALTHDPAMFPEYTLALARACRDQGLRLVASTAGYVGGAARGALFAALDAVQVDLLAFTEPFYYHRVGARLSVVIETLEWLATRGSAWVELTLHLPQTPAEEGQLARHAHWVAETLGRDVPIHLAMPLGMDADRRARGLDPRVRRAREIVRAAGIHHVYAGRLSAHIGAGTYCPGCGRRVIGRDPGGVADWSLDADLDCAHCGSPIRGIFDAPAARVRPDNRPDACLAGCT